MNQKRMTKDLKNKYVISIDSSSSACKTLIIDIEGRVVKSSSIPIKFFLGENGFFEHDPFEIWESQLTSLKNVLDGINLDQVLGISITNQRETVVAWDCVTKKPICRAISWQDKRNEGFFDEYKNYEEFLKNKTGLVLSSYFSVSKIRWILENTNYSLENLRIGTVDSWLIFNLTDSKVFATDVTNASRTMLMDLREESWDDELLNLFKIPKSILPKIFPSGHLYGFWNYKGKEIPILGVIGDQQASLLYGGFKPGTIKATYGTGLFLMSNLGTNIEILDKTVTTVAWKIGNKSTQYALECGSFVGGNYVQKIFKDGLFNDYGIKNGSYEEVIYVKPLIKKIFMFDDFICPDFSVGLSPNETGERVFKGVLTFIASIMDKMLSDFKRKFNIREIIVGGNLTNIDYLNALQSSMSSVCVKKFHHENNSALGAAYLVFLTLGEIEDSELNEMICKNLVICGIKKSFFNVFNLKEWLNFSKSTL